MHPIKTYKFNKFEKLKKNRFTVDVFCLKKQTIIILKYY